MIELADIKAALVTILETIPNVDVVNQHGWFPNLVSSTIAITIPPLRTESQYGFTQSRSAEPDYQAHRFYCEVWVRDDGNPVTLDERMSGINAGALATLLASQTFAVDGALAYLGWWDGDRMDYSITFQVEEEYRRLIGDEATFLVAIMSIPVTVMG